MARTLSQILIDSNSYLDLEAALPTGDDLGVRVAYAQQAVREWADSYSWRQLSTYLNLFVTNSTLPLPDNFKELESAPVDVAGNGYPEVMNRDVSSKGSTDDFCFVIGNEAGGHNISFNGLTSSLASLTTVFQRTPSNMATLADYCEVPDDIYVVQKINSLVLQSRSDERFPTVEADAQRRLANMIGRETIQTPGGNMTVRKSGATKWRIGTPRG